MLEKMISKLVGRPVSREEAEQIFNKNIDLIKKVIKEAENDSNKN